VGISLASFSSGTQHALKLGPSGADFSGPGLGELTFLQLSTRYHPPSVMGYCVGWVAHFIHSMFSRYLRYFASGTGGAGLAGAGLWWFLRRLGLRTGVGFSSVRMICVNKFSLPISRRSHSCSLSCYHLHMEPFSRDLK
jgi:hypothetical protein